MNLNKVINDAQQGDQGSFIEILERFKPSILKFSRELGYDEAQNDLTLSLLEFIRKPPKSSVPFLSEGAAVNYIYRILRNKRNDLFKEKRKYEVEISFLPEVIKEAKIENKLEEKYIIKEALNQLTKKQKRVIIMRYIDGYSDEEISKEIGVSRQSICKTRNAGIKILREILD